MTTRPTSTTTRAEEVKEALTDALLRLLQHQSLDGVSVRQVGAEAGVNHGLVHRHFGSKEELGREAIRRASRLFHELEPGQRASSARTFALFAEHPELPTIVARCCLDGPHDLLSQAAPPPQNLEQCIEPLRAQLERLGLSEHIDPHVINALASAALLGWFLFQPLLRSGFGLGDDANEQLERIIVLLDTWLGAGRAEVVEE